MGRGSGLDPKRTKAFNFTTVQGHFKLFKETMEKNNIPWRNIYNMDEKGVQMGGGQKGTRTKYFFAQDDKMKYKLQSDELQLVTIIDSICADGEDLPEPPIMLIYDGHGSHTTLEWVNLARENTIILFCLPPHTTHCL
ncbi:hypothetical protein BYT27DRAFT_7229086 [Phlegmacium glaucopus]|nr:hypothetical protein BYT27DRAFT_7229086 [Phlegmacium glaucopus]